MEVDRFGQISFVLICANGLNHLNFALLYCDTGAPVNKSSGAEASLQKRRKIGIDVVLFEPSKSSINATPFGSPVAVLLIGFGFGKI